MASSGIVGHDDGGAGEVVEVAAQVAADRRPGAGVEGGQGLVEQEQARARWPAPGRGRPVGPGRPTAGRGSAPALVGEAEAVEPDRPPAVRASAPGHAPGAQAEGDVVERAQVREQQVVLEHHGRPARCSGGDGTSRPRDRRAPSRRARCGHRRAPPARPGRAGRWSCRRRWDRARPRSRPGRRPGRRRGGGRRGRHRGGRRGPPAVLTVRSCRGPASGRAGRR